MSTHDESFKRHLTDLPEDLDVTLEQIDEVLEQNSEDFVAAYVAKGAQGPTGDFTIQFFASAIAGGVAGHATYDMVKAALKRTFKAFRQAGGPIADKTDGSGAFLDAEDEALLRAIYQMVIRIPSPAQPLHDPVEAMAAHWIIYFKELLQELRLVQLSEEHYRKLKAIGRDRAANLSPAQQVAEIIDDWLRRHPEIA